MIQRMMTETEAIAWLSERNITCSLRTLKAMRTRREIAWFELKRGTPKIRFTEAQLLEGFLGPEVPKGGSVTARRKRVPSGFGSKAELDALLLAGRAATR